MIEIRAYIDLLGRNQFERWFESLDPTVRFRILRGINRLQDGNDAAVKAVGNGVLELRMHFGPGYRVYFGRDGDALILLLGGGSKQRQDRDIAAAKERWREYIARAED